MSCLKTHVVGLFVPAKLFTVHRKLLHTPARLPLESAQIESHAELLAKRGGIPASQPYRVKCRGVVTFLQHTVRHRNDGEIDQFAVLAGFLVVVLDEQRRGQISGALYLDELRQLATDFQCFTGANLSHHHRKL